MIVLAIMGAAFTGTQAQARQACNLNSKKVVHHHRRAVQKTTVAAAHQVCTEENGYYTCCVYKNKSTRVK